MTFLPIVNANGVNVSPTLFYNIPLQCILKTYFFIRNCLTYH